MRCARCQQENPPQAKFCLECAAPLALRCANCGTQQPASAKFCFECATPVSAPGSAPRFVSPEAYADVPQVYLTDAGGAKRMRLLGFERVELEPGESKEVAVNADPRLLARFDSKAGQWRIAGGTYKVVVAQSAVAPVLAAETKLQARLFGN